MAELCTAGLPTPAPEASSLSPRTRQPEEAAGVLLLKAQPEGTVASSPSSQGWRGTTAGQRPVTST